GPSSGTTSPAPAATSPAPVATTPPAPQHIETAGHLVHHDGPLPALVHHDGPLPGIPGVPREQDKMSLPLYVVEPPDILLIRASPSVLAPVGAPLDGQHLVRPDGFLNLGVYGDVYVAGLTLDAVRDAVAAQILVRTGNKDLTPEKVKLELQVDVLAYNSK